jgi:hypothetical protein
MESPEMQKPREIRGIEEQGCFRRPLLYPVELRARRADISAVSYPSFESRARKNPVCTAHRTAPTKAPKPNVVSSVSPVNGKKGT